MPQLPMIGVQSMVSPGDVAGGSGGRGSRELLGAIEGGIGDVGRVVQAQQALAKKQQLDEGLVAVTKNIGESTVAAHQAWQDAMDGGTVAGFTDRLSKQFDQETQQGASAIPQVAQSLYQERRASLRAQLLDRFAGPEHVVRQQGLSSDFMGIVQTSAQTAFVDPSQAPDKIANARSVLDFLDIPADQKAKLQLHAEQTIAYGAASNIATNQPGAFLKRVGVGAADPAAAAEAVKADPVLSNLGPQQLETLTQHAQSRVAQQQSAADRAQQEADKIGNDAYNKLSDFTNQGQTPDLTYVAEVTKAAQGTAWAVPVQGLLQRASKSAGFGSASLPQQEAALAQFSAQMAHGTNPDDVAMVNSLRAIHGNQVQAYKDDPLEAGARFAKLPAQAPQQIASVAQALQLAQQRSPLLAGYETAAGAPGVSPFHPAEAQQLAGEIRKLPPDQAATALTTLGASLGSADRIAAVGKQLGDKDGTLGLAMAFAGNKLSDGRLVAELVLRGDQALKDKTSQEDTAKVTGWRATIATAVRGAYPNQQVEDAAIDAAVKITAGREAMGLGAGDTETAVKYATGGIIEHGSVGGKIPLPYGMQTASDFEKKLAAIKPADLAAQARTADYGPAAAVGMLARGNIDLGARPVVKNADGSISTVRSISIGVDGGREVLIPTVSDDGRVLSDKDAIALYRQTGRNLGTFGSAGAATAYAKQLHEAQAAQYAGGPREDVVYAGKTAVPISSFVSSLPSATLVHAGQARYVVRAGSGYVTNAAGAPIVLQVKP